MPLSTKDPSLSLLRAILFYVGMSIALVITVVPTPLLYPFPKRFHRAFLGYWAPMCLRWLKFTCNLDYRVKGAENIPHGPAIILAKHQSAFETVALQAIFPPQTWVLKKELMRIPFLGWSLAMLQSIPIDRSAGKKALRQVVEQGTDRLQQGIWLVIFPEGTRVAPGITGRYGIGGAMLACKSGYPVVPVAHNAGEFWPKQGFRKRTGTITVSVGPVIDPAGKSSAEVNELAKAWIEAECQRLSTLAPDTRIPGTTRQS